MAKRITLLIFAGALLCTGSVATLDAMTAREQAKMSDLVTVTVNRSGEVVNVDSSATAFASDRARLAKRIR